MKVVVKCGLLSDHQKRQAAESATRAGAAFVKTSTGFLGSGATVHDVTVLRQAAGPSVAIKATGGIRFFEDAVELLQAGASRLGTSATEAVQASRIGWSLGPRSSAIHVCRPSCLRHGRTVEMCLDQAQPRYRGADMAIAQPTAVAERPAQAVWAPISRLFAGAAITVDATLEGSWDQ